MVVLGKGVVKCEKEHPWREAAQGPLQTGIIAQAEGGCFFSCGVRNAPWSIFLSLKHRTRDLDLSTSCSACAVPLSLPPRPAPVLPKRWRCACPCASPPTLSCVLI